jgi:hypothetical protein
MKVFISYAKADVAIAKAIAIRLKQERQRVFFDRSDIPTGSTFDSHIREQIARTDFLIFLASPDSLAPGAYALTELSWFEERFSIPDGRVLTVLLRNQQLRDLPPYLRSVSIPSFEGDLFAEVTGRTLQCLRLIRRSAIQRWLAALVLILAIAGVCWAVFPDRYVRFEVVDSVTEERVRRPLTLIVDDQRTGKELAVEYEPPQETWVLGRLEEMSRAPAATSSTKAQRRRNMAATGSN